MSSFYSKGVLNVKLALMLLALTILGGCGGSGGGGTSGTGSGSTSGSGEAFRSANLGLELPQGSSITAASLKLVSPHSAEDQSFSEAGQVRTSTPSEGKQLMAAVDSAGDPVLIGFVGGTSPKLSVRTSIDALAFMELGAFMAPTENQSVILDQIERSQELNEATTMLQTELATNPKALTNKTSPYRRKISEFVGRRMGTSSPTRSAISPYPGRKSGVTIEYGQERNEIYAVNEFRRRAIMFVDRVARVESSGAEVADYRAIGSVELDPANGSVRGTDIIGNLGGYPVRTNSRRITLETPPEGVKKYKYKVAVCGPGAQAGENYVLSDSQRTAYRALLKRTFMTDFLLNALNISIATTNIGSQGDPEVSGTPMAIYGMLLNHARTRGDAITALIDSEFPQAEQQMTVGDFRGAMRSALNAVWSDESKQGRLAIFYASMLREIPNFPLQPSEVTVRRMLGWIRRVVDTERVSSVLSEAFNRFPQGSDYNSSKKIETWDAETNKVIVTLTPRSSRVDTRGENHSVTLRAQTQGLDIPAGARVLYRFRTEGRHGTLRNRSGGDRIQIESEEDSVLYSSRVGLQATNGTDTVTCEVVLAVGEARVVQGNANATVEVTSRAEIEIMPRRVSISNNRGHTTLSVQTQNPTELQSGRFKIRWRKNSELFEIKTNPLNSDRALSCDVDAPANGAEGRGKVFADLIEARTNEVLGTAEAEVRVEARRTIYIGSVEVSGGESYDAQSGWGSSWSAISVTFPKVDGARRYDIHCYNFNDTAYYGREIRRSIGPDLRGLSPDLDENDKDTSPPTFGARGFYRMGLTGGVGFGPGRPEAGSSRRGARDSMWRFAGMVPEVTVTF